MPRNNASPFTYRVWQLQDYDLDHILRLVGMAASAMINRIQLSHQIVMKAEQPLSNAQLAADINTICERAHSLGVSVDMWTHELSGVPAEFASDGRADLDDARLWEHVEEKYRRLFEVCPHLDGLVLSMQETQMSIYHEKSVSSSQEPEKRVATLIDRMGDVCKAFSKEFFVRTFSYEPAELKIILNGLKQCKADVIVMTKCVPHDWQPYYPPNPAIGNVGGKRQIIEFDLGHEFTGLSAIPYINIEYTKRHLDYDIGKGAVGAVFRVERHKWRAIDTPNQAVIDVCTQLLSDPSADPEQLYRRWLADRYGAAAVDALYSAFGRTQEIVDKTYFVLGYWVTNHSLLPSAAYASKSLTGRTTAKWDPSTKPTEQELYNPTRSTIAKIDAEKDEALRLADASLEDIEKARPALKPEDYRQLKELFERERAAVLVWKAAMDVFFGLSLYRSSGSSDDAGFLKQSAERLEGLAGEHKAELIAMAADYARPQNPHNYDQALGLVDMAGKALER